jgi:vesicle transport through interaction with t-SNAREs 1
MANPLDTDAGSELFSSYEAEFKLVQADLTQKLDQIPELQGEPRKAAVSQAERALEEAEELVRIDPSPEMMEYPSTTHNTYHRKRNLRNEIYREREVMRSEIASAN